MAEVYTIPHNTATATTCRLHELCKIYAEIEMQALELVLHSERNACNNNIMKK